MKAMLVKLTSRKFLLSAISMAAGIALLCGADADVVATLSGAAMTVIPALLYCIVEGRIDVASVKQATGALGDAATALGADPAVKTVIDAAGDALGAVCPEKAE